MMLYEGHMRFILVTFITLVMVGMLLLMARIWGLGQVYPPFEHDFFQGNQPLIILKADTLDTVAAAVKAQPDVIIWADVRMSKDKVPYVLPRSEDVKFLEFKKEQQEKNPSTPIMMGGKLTDYPWEQINEFYKTTPALKEYYEQFPQTRFILNVVDNVTDVHLDLVNALEGLKPDARTLIQSEALIVITAIKDKKPEWVYGTSTPDLMRFLSFDSLWILPTTQFKGDVFIAPFTLMKRPAFNQDIIEEMRRRHKRIFLGPIESKAQFDQAKSIEANGYITTDLAQLKSWLDQDPAQ
ncbi:hypothetical protein D3C87_111680 [compost metagenome]